MLFFNISIALSTTTKEGGKKTKRKKKGGDNDSKENDNAGMDNEQWKKYNFFFDFSECLFYHFAALPNPYFSNTLFASFKLSVNPCPTIVTSPDPPVNFATPPPKTLRATRTIS